MRRLKSGGVNVLGYFTAEHGIGEAARLLLSAIQTSGLPTAAVTVLNPAARSAYPFEEDGREAAEYDTTIICTTPHELAYFHDQLHADFFDGRYTIAYLWWELPTLPEEWAPALGFVDEIWVANEYVAASLRPSTPTPVRTVPLPVSVTEFSEVSPAAAGLPQRFVFLFSFDFVTIFIRKNPLGLVEAFRRAFGEDDGAFLLLKSIDGDARPEHLATLSAAIADRSDIELRDGFVPAADKDLLTAACDCFVSLHRCEGLGLTLAEAMLYAKPVIATAYSGNLSFMTEDNSYLVPYTLGRVPEGWPPFPVGAEWADPDIKTAARLMRHVFENPAEARDKGQRAKSDVRAKHSPEAVGSEIRRQLARIRRRRRRQAFLAGAGPVRRMPKAAVRAAARGLLWPVRRVLDPRFAGLERGLEVRQQELLRRLDELRAEALRLNHERVTADTELIWLLNATRAEHDDLKADLHALEARLAALEGSIQGRTPPTP